MFCSNCGQNLAGVATQYCPNCGHAEEILKKINAQPQVGIPPHQPPQHQQAQYQPPQYQAPPHGYPPQGHPPYPQGYMPPGYSPYGLYVKPPAQGLAGAALGLGIAAFVLPVPFLDLILGIIAIILAVAARKQGNRAGLGTAGLVLSIVGLVTAAIHTFFYAFIFTGVFMFGW